MRRLEGPKLGRMDHCQLRMDCSTSCQLALRLKTKQNATFYQFSEDNNYVFDQRGYSAFIQGEASTFLTANDSRLLLNTIVTNISYSGTGVTVYSKDGSCIDADYAICTFS